VHDDENLPVSAIMAGGDVICWVLESDARQYGMTRQELAQVWLAQIRTAIEEYRRAHTATSYLKGAAFAVIATIVLVGLWFLLRYLCRREIQSVEKRFAGRQMLKFVDGDSLVAINGNLLKLFRTILMLVLFVFYLNAVFSFFPWTFNLSARLFQLITTPLINFGRAFVANLPNLFAILMIIVIVNVILRSLKHAFRQIGEERVRIRGFYADWADTTYRLVRMVIIIFALVAAFPYIPGSNSPAFKGISIFMGVLFSLGSTSTVGNIFGGLMLTYMRSFQPGDFVEISGLKGTVMARRTFSTRLRTPTNEIISIPNAQVSSNTIINYSNMTKSIGVNIGTSVTIGYDVPWRTVHELLIAAAAGVEDVLDDPAPTVLQLSLDDFYITYKLVVATKRPDRMLRILSDVHQNIQDRFAEAGVEIMSPHYRANRSGESPAIPDIG
jgi:small-conductance mechanosensitive channel